MTLLAWVSGWCGALSRRLNRAASVLAGRASVLQGMLVHPLLRRLGTRERRAASEAIQTYVHEKCQARLMARSVREATAPWPSAYSWRMTPGGAQPRWTRVRASAGPPKWSHHSSAEGPRERRIESLRRGPSLSRETWSLAAETPRLCDLSGALSAAMIRQPATVIGLRGSVSILRLPGLSRSQAIGACASCLVAHFPTRDYNAAVNCSLGYRASPFLA